MVGVNISHSYFHPGGAHITRVKIISHTGMKPLRCCVTCAEVCQEMQWCLEQHAIKSPGTESGAP